MVLLPNVPLERKRFVKFKTKKRMKKVITYLVVVCFGILTMNAQQNNRAEKRAEHKESREKFMASLSDAQKTELQFHKQMREDHKKAFEATFTEEQIAIKNNDSLSRKEKRQAMKASFTAKQKEMKTVHKNEMKAAKEKFAETLSEEQKVLREKMVKGRKHRKHARKKK